MKNLRINFYLILIFAFLTQPGKAITNDLPNKVADTVRILTIGNSFADNACKYLKQITESVEGSNIIIGKANIGGCYLEKHADLMKQSESDPTLRPHNGKSLKEWLLTDDWDIVTIQQVSHLSFKAETYQPYADEIRDYVNKYAPQAKIYIHETWAYAPDCPRLKGFGITSDQMFQGLKNNYEVLSERYNSPILPSGDAFNRSFKKTEEIDLWSSNDRFHANENGCYLAACVWFKELFGKSPKKIKFRPEQISKKTARYLRRVASK
ncbi:DUF4886 domain-containing protein [Arenibacter sp. F26102]|uniref:DUF4886 domain-containing protein n=1 Tax=Arenibacter sp. F26102 TaxID=2926416 RepID=UPI001FF3F525|nr:DUF4886 domain-containing protein [Arenibacter sp. F26102]MCK0146488.1 DUF4886 domain-containing protein [Arenibacter sp. F26102]